MTAAEFIAAHRNDDVKKLALKGAPDGINLAEALTQIEGYQLASTKLPSWSQISELHYPPRLSMEQCSSELTANYKRALVQRLLHNHHIEPRSFIDLTSGFGVDFATIAPLFAEAHYVDQQESLCTLAAHNMPLLHCAHAHVHCSKTEDLLAALPADERFTLVMIDPARRDAHQRKVALVQDCEPNLERLQDTLLQHCTFALVKLSPMLDITAALRTLKNVREVHIVSVKDECKELLLVLEGQSSNPTLNPKLSTLNSLVPLHCLNLPSSADFVFTFEEEQATQLSYAVTPPQAGQYLYLPNASILKAGAFKTLTQRYPVQKLAHQSHLYLAEQPIENFPGTAWEIIATTTFAKASLKAFLKDLPAAELTVRGFPITVAQLRKQLHLKEGGRTHLIATTLADNSKILIRVERVKEMYH